MSQFLKVKPPAEVLRIIMQSFAPLERETVALSQAFGRVLGGALKASEPVPHFARSVMDGYAVRARDTFGASESLPAFLEVEGEVTMGRPALSEVKPGRAVAIPTGGMLPAGADAVVMVEYTHQLDERTIEVTRPAAPGDHVLDEGEDIARDSELFSAGHRLRPQDAGVLAALGVTEISVHRRPRVALLSTGDEIVPVDTPELEPGKIRDINTYSLAGQVREAGGLVGTVRLVPDDLDILAAACEEALQDHDAVMLSGGSSVGARDYTVRVLDRLPGAELLVQGIAMRPGKPTILARVGQKAFWGLPGHPASAMMVFTAFVRPFLSCLQGLPEKERLETRVVKGVLTSKLPSVQGRADYFPVAVTPSGGGFTATPLFGKSAMIRVLAQADGYVIVPEHVEGLDAGTEVEVHLFSLS